jgi:hypothetical protein
MKQITQSGFILFSLLIASFMNAHAQFILAGNHQPGNHYVDIIPDTTLIGPYTHIPPQPPATFPIDLDGDNQNDFLLHSLGFWMNGGGSTKISIRAYRNNCQIALCCIDSCGGNIALSLIRNDSINERLNWSHDSILFLSHTRWDLSPYSCGYNGFVNNSLGNYLALRIINPQDTIYGWLKVTDVDWSAYTVQEFAGSSRSYGVVDRKNDTRVYPVPTKDFLNIETLKPDFTFILYDSYGTEVMKNVLREVKTRIDLRNVTNGLYVMKFCGENTVVVKKIIKE